jgi:RNA polymerase sigma-70 factor (ECF subfamily)
MEASRAASPARRAPAAHPPARLRHAADRALEQLYDRHARDVYHYALALLANVADAEDVTQTTFLNAYNALLRGDRPHRPHNWLITITHNVCRMRWRQASHRPREVALDEAPEPAAFEHDQPNLTEVLDALAGLSFNQRAALVMRELEGRSCKEIAKTLEVSVSSVEALLFRARRRLKLERGALGVISTAPLPGSPLASILGLGGGGGGASAAAAGGTAVGANLAVKAAALLAIGAIVTGAVGVAKEIRQIRSPAAARVAPASIAQAARPTPKGATKTRAHATRTRRAHPARPAATQTQTKTQTPAHTAQGTPAGSPSGAAAQTPPSPRVPPVRLPRVPLPPLPPVQVELPPVEVPELPVELPVQLPPLPPLPPVPPLPPLPPLNP